jgi:hypothetical protein
LRCDFCGAVLLVIFEDVEVVFGGCACAAAFARGLLVFEEGLPVFEAGLVVAVFDADFLVFGMASAAAWLLRV